MAAKDGKDGQAKPALVEQTKEHEAHKSPSNILKQEIKQGLEETRRPAGALLVSGLSAGLELGFSVLLIAVLMTLDQGTLHPAARELLLAAAYTVGFVFIIIGHSELFTEHTSLGVFPVLNRDSTLGELARLWGLVYVSNLIGAAAIAGLIAYLGPGLGIIDPAVLGELGRRAAGHPPLMLLLSGVLAGWLMGLLSWLVTAARETVSQVLIILLVTGTIGLAHLQHAIAGGIEVFAGLFAGQGITWANVLHFLVWATLGNILGGGLLVALLKYGHASHPGHAPDQVEVRG